MTMKGHAGVQMCRCVGGRPKMRMEEKIINDG